MIAKILTDMYPPRLYIVDNFQIPMFSYVNENDKIESSRMILIILLKIYDN